MKSERNDIIRNFYNKGETRLKWNKPMDITGEISIKPFTNTID
jgi:hypothetical protein